ncbi:uncharacterized protein LOC129960209 isoform X2 [Argiope bruennichi]|uniref:DUF4592 domain-containing protein n=1 Tax=Argiope bruennichi TaxID=94029 RepID=A0A8T0FMH0_ARGBR|nr:uncharacterized protein LOC129960209 isoform X2 [Argiope bruennichi]KAF8791418.1 hypothetical protein HNY73_006286 [Argiope bruennichi]
MWTDFYNLLWIHSRKLEAKWKRFHPFRVVRKIFRRRIKREGTSVSDASKKSWSTSELQSVQDDGTGKREVTSPLKIGLSVSHDSIFSPESSTNAVSSETLNASHGSSLSVHHTTIKNMFKDELFTRVRARRDSDDDDDAGLPHSPCTSPTTVDVLTQGLKEKSPKSQTTCSAGSLISMGSSENDEDSAGQSSGHSSRMSLIDRRSLDSDGDTDSSQPVPLNHNAAHHKIAVRPKRTYGLPRRRMNQVAASKVSTLPSTPEVTEDSVKSFQKFEALEVVKTFTEFSASSLNEFSSSKQSSEWQVTQMTSSFSYNEVSDLTREVVSHMEKSSTSESYSQIYNENIEENSKIMNGEDIKPLPSIDIVTPEAEGTVSQSFISKESDTEFVNKEETKSFYDSYEKRCDDTEAENSKAFRNENKEDHAISEIKENFLKESEASLKVSSLVRNLEKSESFKKSEKLFKGKEEMKISSCQNTGNELMPELSSVQMKVSNSCAENSETSKPDLMKENFFPKIQLEKTNEYASSTEEKLEMKTQSKQEFVKEVRMTNVPNKLDIDSEFILKTVKRDISLDKNLDLTCKEKSGDKENPLISSLYFEEESIMSSKSLSMGVEESGIFVSHHASFKDDVKDMVVTEAHNFAAVEENAGIFIQATGDILNDKKIKSSDSWVSSVDIPASMSMNSDVTVSSSTSTLCTNKMTDEKITISVNAKPEPITSVVSPLEQDEIKQSAMESSENAALPSKQDMNQRPSQKEKHPVKPAPKPQLLESNSNATGMKNINAQKRVSVEIVPFSQRMKERKYQPISFGSKDQPSDQNKKSTSTSIERKLSDRKVTVKNKELDKANNRHSFSGALVSDNKKTETVIEKKIAKQEKVQYPVQIRIHKSIPKPEIKDKVNVTAANKGQKNSTNKTISSEVKFQVQGSKITQNDTKLVKEEKSVQDASAKWEVKIQPSVSHNNHINKSQIVDDEVHSSSLLSEINAETMSDPRKSPVIDNENKVCQNPQDSESLAMKSNENKKNTKEAPLPLSDDPEPELLRVFARRSIKQKNCDKSKAEEPQESSISDASLDDSSHIEKTEESNEISVSDNSTVIKISEISKPHIKTHDLKKKSKSFCEKEKVAPRAVSPLKEMNLIHRESLVKLSSESSISSETIHPRQRLASVPDIPLNLPPDSIKNSPKESNTESSPVPPIKEEIQQKTSSTSVPAATAPMNGSVTSIGMAKESQETMNEKEPHAPSWLQLAQQRRELREQRERLLLGGSPNSFMDASNKPSRSSKVWDMVNNFQKLQMT